MEQSGYVRGWPRTPPVVGVHTVHIVVYASMTGILPLPCQSFFEPNYETSKAVRWRIRLAGDRPTAIAGLWRAWEQVDEIPTLSFTMLTVNADEHPLMRRFHKPGDEKRSVVIVRPDAYADWLSCKSTDEARSFLNLYPAAEMFAEPFPLPPRAPKTMPTGL